MRKFLLLFTFVIIAFCSKAQLADGSTAPNWTLTDINGTTWTLYDILNQGKPVAIDFSATWCGPCWSYHNGGALEGLYEDFGPSGTNELMVFFIEPDVSTNLACLYGPSGCVGGTQGNWVAGTPYPIINTTTSQINNDYDINYYPTLYAISPDKEIYEVGQPSQTGWETWLFDSFSMEVTGSSTNATCPNAGSVSLDVTGGYLTKTYEWSNGANTQDLTGVNAGTYTVTVSDSHGYSKIKSFVVTGPSTTLNVNNAVVDPITCATYNNGSIALNTGGGYPGYSYDWSTGASTNIVSDLAPGTYSVVVTDNQGCTLGESFVVEEPDPITSFAFANNATCGNTNGSVTIDAEGGTGTHYFQIGTSNAQTQNYFFDLAAGVYEYTVTDNNGCFNTSQFEILSTGSPAAQAAPSGQLNCAVSQVTISGTGSATGANITYLWTTTNGNIVSGANTINAVVNAVGTYNLKVTNTTQGCSSNTTTQVTYLNNAPSANAGAPSTLTCAVPQVVLNGAASSSGANFTYAWSTANGNIVSGANTATPTVNDPGTYNLLITDTNTGCTAASNVVITEDVLSPSITVNDVQLTCAVNSAQICATVGANVNVTWTINATQVPGTCATVTTAGSYVATAQAASNGCTTTATSTVTSAAGLPQLAAASPAPLTCTVAETIINGEVTGNPADFNISWTTANGNIVSGATTLTPTVNKGGTYTMSAINIATGCASSINVDVNQTNNTPIAQYSTALANGQLALSSMASATGTTTWDLGNGQTASGNNVTISYPTSGTYTICMTLTNECGVNTSCTDVAYFTAFAVNGTVSDAKCAGENGAVATTVSGGPITGAVSYLWTGPNGFTSTDASISNVPAGIYTCVITDGAGLTATSSFTITAPAAIETTAAITNATNSKANGAITLTTSGGTGVLSVTWSNGATGTTITDLAPGTYTANVVDANGCQKVYTYVVESINSVNDPAFVSAMSIYPNPTSTILNFELTTSISINAKLSIINNVGQIMTSKSISGSNFNDRLDVSALTPGIYTLQVKNNEGVAFRRFIVSK